MKIDRKIKFALRKNSIEAAKARKQNRDEAKWKKNVWRSQVPINEFFDRIGVIYEVKP